jgi:hypothetical protein
MIITGFDLNSVLMQTKQLFGSGGCTSVIVAILVAVAGGLILFFVKRCFGHLDENDKRIEGSVKKLNSWAFGIDKRVSRIEGHLKISPFSSASPIELTDIGKEILNKSGIKEIADQFKLQLIEAIRKYNTSTAYDTQESTRRVFQEFNFGEENLKN